MGISNRTYTLRNCAYIVDSQQAVKTGNIVIEGQYIRSVGNEVEGDEIDCSQFIVVPGLVNAHTHLAMTVLRGFFLMMANCMNGYLRCGMKRRNYPQN